MSRARRHENPGKREREAGKRHRRALVGYYGPEGSVAVPLKLGKRHLRRWSGRGEFFRKAMAVAESEKRATGAPENG